MLNMPTICSCVIYIPMDKDPLKESQWNQQAHQTCPVQVGTSAHCTVIHVQFGTWPQTRFYYMNPWNPRNVQGANCTVE